MLSLLVGERMGRLELLYLVGLLEGLFFVEPMQRGFDDAFVGGSGGFNLGSGIEVCKQLAWRAQRLC